MSAPLARLSSAPGLPALLWTPARWWLPPRQQLEQQRPSLQDLLLPSAVVPSAPSAPARLESRLSPPAGRRAQGAGRRDSGGAPGARLCTSHLRPSRLPPRSRGAGTPLPAANQQCLDAVEVEGGDAWEEGVPAASLGFGFWIRDGVRPGNTRGSLGGNRLPSSPPTAWEGRGVGGTCFSRKGSVLLQRVLSLPFSTFPPATSFPPKRPRPTPCQGFESISILRILHPGREWEEEAVGAKML